MEWSTCPNSWRRISSSPCVSSTSRRPSLAPSSDCARHVTPGVKKSEWMAWRDGKEEGGC
eukprot:847645-Rhodomonas_salina.2